MVGVGGGEVVVDRMNLRWRQNVGEGAGR
jgi:hypothetical protein